MPGPFRGFAEIVAKGDRLESLTALRDRLALAIELCSDAGDLSSLALRLTRVLEQISELGGEDNEEANELAERRRSKLSAAAGS